MTQDTICAGLSADFERMPAAPSQKFIQSKEWNDLARAQTKSLQKLAAAHIDSFNFMTNQGLARGLDYLQPVSFEYKGSHVQLKINDLKILPPTVNTLSKSASPTLYPSECRMRKISYCGRLLLSIQWSLNNRVQDSFEDVVGAIPIMVKSNRCNLEGLSRQEMVKHKEDEEEFGGYFIMNGNEYLLRKLIAQRRNYPMAISRTSWRESGQFFSEFGISIRCVRADQLGSNMVLHYLTNGTVKLRFFYNRTPIYLPLILCLKVLCDVSDEYILKELRKGREGDQFYEECIKFMLRQLALEKLHSSEQCKAYIGSRMRSKAEAPSWVTDQEVTEQLFRETVAVHLTDNHDKFNLLIEMTKKLFAFAQGECSQENPDNPMFHEVYQSGHIYFTLLLERLQMFLTTVRDSIQIAGRIDDVVLGSQRMRRFFSSKYSTITRPMEFLISTGNLQSKTGLGLMQTAGISVKAEKINFWRFLAHFRCVHRGQFFQEMKTTACRKLYPEAWGFLCPVHTPDGSPCGLLNHFAEHCSITNATVSTRGLPNLLEELGMLPVGSLLLGDRPVVGEHLQTVMLDGRVIGFIPEVRIAGIVEELRYLKAAQKTGNSVPETLEIGHVPRTGKATQYPGLYLFSTPSRMVRPVVNLRAGGLELIGSFEQCYLNICVVDSEAISGLTTHREATQTSFLSVLSRMIPFPDFNQSPRNMYSCQMAKQTMGTASHTLKYRSDNKMYSVATPQSPLVRCSAYDYYKLDNFPLGTNAVVAVISYTGFDMEDAMIINKASVERGFQAGLIHKTEIVDLRELGDVGKYSSETVFTFGYPETEENHRKYCDLFDCDGLPFVGRKVTEGQPVLAYMNESTGEVKFHKYKSSETAFIFDVKLLGDDRYQSAQKVAITFLIRRDPVIGDKFANRHGQKGICSFLWPQEDMPFTENGIIPDIIFNPHGFPSRMTIGQMIETLAGKVGAMQGKVFDSTPFNFSEKNHASHHYGKMLEETGFNYYGTERLYSGVDGRKLEAKIFIGVVYYIRLRHMVGDKYQVRSTGPIDQITRQPVKGRKRAGGIRFGEMERDSLLAHGTSFLLQDRLFNCSDRTIVHLCRKCGSIISPYLVKSTNPEVQSSLWSCKTCEAANNVVKVAIPFVLQYLVSELASVNIKVKFSSD